MRGILAFYVLLIILIPTRYSQANEIEEVLPGGLLASADYYQGDTGKPAIFLLHGFLTVHSFNLIKDLAEELAGNQYTVLTPTLTLGINKRKSTLDCNALHLHNMENDTREIDWWVKWLIRKGHKKIILMGHSSGSLQVMHYISTHKHKEVVKVIGLSVVPLTASTDDQFIASIEKANNMIRNRNDNIENFTLSYCRQNYSAPARQFMSYAQLNADQIIKTLGSIKITKIIINGSDDIPVYQNWISDLKDTGTRVNIINGADHFFGSGSIFELYDSIMLSINQSP